MENYDAMKEYLEKNFTPKNYQKHLRGYMNQDSRVAIRHSTGLFLYFMPNKMLEWKPHQMRDIVVEINNKFQITDINTSMEYFDIYNEMVFSKKIFIRDNFRVVSYVNENAIDPKKNSVFIGRTGKIICKEDSIIMSLPYAHIILVLKR